MTDLQSLLRTLEIGSDVAVRSTYDGAWSRGFQVAEVVDQAGFPCYWIRRRSDNTVLSALVPANDVVPDRRPYVAAHDAAHR
jgi:hypothetical protein